MNSLDDRRQFHDLQARIWLGRFFVGVLTTLGFLLLGQFGAAVFMLVLDFLMATYTYGHLYWEGSCGQTGEGECGIRDHSIEKP